jgi:putative tricarboxylic transport membrane protein
VSPFAALRRADPAGLVVAVLLVVTSAIIFWDASRLTIGSTYGLGPQAVPNVIAAGLFLLGIGNLVMAIRHEFPPREEASPKAILLILGGLVALMALIASGAGFILATAILFACTSAAFGRRAFVTDFGIGLMLGAVIYLLFVKLLTLGLPQGPLERLL